MSARPPLLNDFLARVPPPPPYLHTGARVHSVWLPVERDRLQDLCDAWFQGTSGGQVKYWVLLPRLFVLIANIAEVQTTAPTHADLGVTQEVDVGLWTLAVRTWPLSLTPRWIPLRLLVDSADAIVVGREVYGFPKEAGRFAIPPGAPSSGPFDVQGYVTRRPNDHMAWDDVINVRSTGAPGAAPAIWKSMQEATDAVVDELMSLLDLGPLGPLSAAAVRASFTPGLFPFAFLKQIMDSAQTDRACYRAIVEAQSRLQAFRRGGFTHDEFEVRITSHHTHPFERVLGIASGQWQKVGRGIWSDFDFLVEAGSNVFEG